MEEKILVLEKKIRELESHISQLLQAQNRSASLFSEFVDKCVDNFREIQKGFDKLNKRK